MTQLTTDPQNANRGTDRGRAALEQSLREYGAGRAVLIDRHGRIIAGNKTVEHAKRLGIPLRVVKTDGHHLIAVQRDDLDLATDPRAKALAIADNRVGELDLEWDVDRLTQLHADGLDLSAFGIASGGTVSSLRLSFFDDSTTASTSLVGALNSQTVGGAIPEPATWAMLLTGFGLVGATMRRRAAATAA